MLDEQQLKDKIAETTAPKVTEEYINSRIKDTTFTRFSDTVTICSILLDNGYSVRGESACVSPENYRQDIGEKIAYDNAFDKLWPLFGFMLAERKSRTAEKQRLVDMIDAEMFGNHAGYLRNFIPFTKLKEFIGVK